MIKRCSILPLLVACASTGGGPNSPQACRDLGVNVKDGDTVTGTLAEEHWTTDQMEIRKMCRVPFDPNRRGCVLVVGLNGNRGIYDIWYMDDYSRKHEKCHLDYEEWRHVIHLESLEGL